MTSPTSAVRSPSPSRSRFATAASRRREQQIAQVVGGQPIEFLGHPPIETAQPCFDVRRRYPELGCRQGRGERRVGVAIDHHRIGRMRDKELLDRRQHPGGLLRVAARSHAEIGRGLGQSPARRRRPRTSRRRSAAQCAPRGARAPGRWPDARAMSRAIGASLTNCGRAPTTLTMRTDSPVEPLDRRHDVLELLRRAAPDRSAPRPSRAPRARPRGSHLRGRPGRRSTSAGAAGRDSRSRCRCWPRSGARAGDHGRGTRITYWL